MNSNAKLQLATLRQYESKSGRTYFLGRMGALKLMLFEDRDAALTGKEVSRWTLFAEQAEPYQPPRETIISPPRRPQGLAVRARASLLERGLDPGEPDRDEPIPF